MTLPKNIGSPIGAGSGRVFHREVGARRLEKDSERTRPHVSDQSVANR